MKRISDEKLKNMKIRTIFIFSLLLLLSLVFCFLPDIFPEPKYDELNEKDIIVSELVLESGRVSTRGIYTSDGEFYHLTGNFDRGIVRDLLVQNTKATIKWCRNPILFFIHNAEEVRVGDSVVVSYNNNDPIPRGPYFLFAGFIVLFDVGILWYNLWEIKHLQTQQEKRNKRIQKKYGNLE